MAGWDDLIGAGLAWWMNRQDQKKPNFYPVPLTPEQKYWDDQKKKLYEAGGSPEMQAIRGAGLSFLGQIEGGPRQHSFLSPLMQGQTFAGGVRIPTFPGIQNLPRTQPKPPGRPGDTGGGGGRGGPGGLGPESDSGGTGRGGAGGVDDLINGRQTGLDNIPGSIPTGSSGNPEQTFGQWFDQFKTTHPNWAQIGVNGVIAAATAALGFPAMLVGRLLKQYLFRDKPQAAPTDPQMGPAKQLPPAHGEPGSGWEWQRQPDGTFRLVPSRENLNPGLVPGSSGVDPNGPELPSGWGQPSGGGGIGARGREDGSFGYLDPDAWVRR